MHLALAVIVSVAQASTYSWPETRFSHTHFSSAKIADVRAAASESNPDAILELGIRQDVTSQPLLRKLAKRASTADGKRFSKIALARMGDQTAFRDLSRNLSSSNYAERAEAIKTLGEIGSDDAIRALIPILDDNSGGHRKSRDLSAPSYASLAADSLIVARTSEWNRMMAESNGSGLVPIAAWKAWWKAKNEKKSGR